MRIICAICTEGHRLSDIRKLADVSAIFYKLTSLEVSNLDDIHQLKLCLKCYEKFVHFDSFRALCLAAYEKLTQVQRESVQVSTSEATQLKGHPVCEGQENRYDPLVGNESFEPEIVFVLPTANNDTLKQESHGSEDSGSSDEEGTVDSIDRTDPSAVESSQTPGDLQCHLCDRKFRSQVRLEGHVREHQGLKPALCKICGKDFTEWKNLKRHKDEKHPQCNQGTFRCDYEGCTLTYSTSKGLYAHKRKHDPAYVKPVPLPCICETCGVTYSSKGALKKHMYIHTGGMPFRCEQCNKSYPTSYKLKVHMMRHQGIKNYECSVCGMRKTTADELKLHMNYHTKEKVFTCHYCGQTFLTSGNFSRHVKLVHRGIKEFKCTYCVRSFGKAETLKNHIMTHTGEKPYKCPVCGKQFIQAHSMQIHAKTHNKKKKGVKSSGTVNGPVVQMVVAPDNGGEPRSANAAQIMEII